MNAPPTSSTARFGFAAAGNRGIESLPWPDAAGSAPVVQFAEFQADLARGELRRHGAVVKLQEKPFQILAVLLREPGRVVSRGNLSQHLWPSGTFVDFDANLNTGLNKLRKALGDSAASPLFIETVPRRGYRFIAPVAGWPFAAAANSGHANPDPSDSGVIHHAVPRWRGVKRPFWSKVNRVAGAVALGARKLGAILAL